MSSSDATDTARWGTVFMGPTASRESRMDKIVNQQERDLWTRHTENEYMERVKARATLRVQTMLDHARSNSEAIRLSTKEWVLKIKLQSETLQSQATIELLEAEKIRAEAEEIRANAYHEGYESGLERAQQDNAAQQEIRGVATATVLTRIQAQCLNIFEAWRDDLAALTREAVECGTGWVLSTEKAAVLEQLLTGAVQALEERRHLIVRVHPEDMELMRALMQVAHEHLHVQGWDVQPDPFMQPGGLVVESDSGRVDNSLSLRRQVVVDALQRLTVPASEADDAAEEAILAPSPELDSLPEPMPDFTSADMVVETEPTIEPDQQALLDLAAQLEEPANVSMIDGMPGNGLPTWTDDRVLSFQPEDLDASAVAALAASAPDASAAAALSSAMVADAAAHMDNDMDNDTVYAPVQTQAHNDPAPIAAAPQRQPLSPDLDPELNPDDVAAAVQQARASLNADALLPPMSDEDLAALNSLDASADVELDPTPADRALSLEAALALAADPEPAFEPAASPGTGSEPEATS